MVKQARFVSLCHLLGAVVCTPWLLWRGAPESSGPGRCSGVGREPLDVGRGCLGSTEVGDFGRESVDDLGIDLVSFGEFGVVLAYSFVCGFEVVDFGLEGIGKLREFRSTELFPTREGADR